MSYCIINSKNFSHNIQIISEHISIDKIAFVLKNNAYGHGLIEMAKIAKEKFEDDRNYYPIYQCNESGVYSISNITLQHLHDKYR